MPEQTLDIKLEQTNCLDPTNSTASPLLFTRSDGTSAFVHDTYINFFIAKYFADEINNRRMSPERLFEDYIARYYDAHHEFVHSPAIVDDKQRQTHTIRQSVKPDDHEQEDIRKNELFGLIAFPYNQIEEQSPISYFWKKTLQFMFNQLDVNNALIVLGLAENYFIGERREDYNDTYCETVEYLLECIFEANLPCKKGNAVYSILTRYLDYHSKWELWIRWDEKKLGNILTLLLNGDICSEEKTNAISTLCSNYWNTRESDLVLFVKNSLKREAVDSIIGYVQYSEKIRLDIFYDFAEGIEMTQEIETKLRCVFEELPIKKRKYILQLMAPHFALEELLNYLDQLPYDFMDSSYFYKALCRRKDISPELLMKRFESGSQDSLEIIRFLGAQKVSSAVRLLGKYLDEKYSFVKEEDLRGRCISENEIRNICIREVCTREIVASLAKIGGDEATTHLVEFLGTSHTHNYLAINALLKLMAVNSADALNIFYIKHAEKYKMLKSISDDIYKKINESNCINDNGFAFGMLMSHLTPEDMYALSFVESYELIPGILQTFRGLKSAAKPNQNN